MAVTVVWNNDAFRELRTAPGVAADLDARAEALAAACGDGFAALPAVTPYSRARRLVGAVTADAAKADATSNVLISNLDAAR